MRYLVTARMLPGKGGCLLRAVVRLRETSISSTCSPPACSTTARSSGLKPVFATPLHEERPYWEEYFELESIKDAHNRKNCLHENGTKPWACGNCDCTKKLDEHLKRSGTAFLADLKRTVR